MKMYMRPKKSILTAIIILSCIISACNKDNSNEPQPTQTEPETFSLSGEWYCPSIDWMSEMLQYNLGYNQASMYKTIRFIEGGNLSEHWQGCFIWNQMIINPTTGEFNAPDTVYFNTNDDYTSITLYVVTRDYLQQAPLQVISPSEMIINDETYLRPQQNPTQMVSLPSRNWHYDFSSNGFFYRGEMGRGQLDLNNPIYGERNGELWVTYNMFKCQVVRPYSDYNALSEQPHGLFFCAGSDSSFEQRLIDYNGVARMANVQNNGGQWCDTICEYAFAGCNLLEEVVLGMQVIEDYAFHGCSLRGIFLWFVPQSVAPTAFDEWQYEHTAVHVSKNHPEILQTTPWNRFRHAYADLERP